MEEPLILNARWGIHEANDVWIDRRTRWGNPFRIGPDGTRAEVIEKHRVWLESQPELLAELESLRGRRLVCWCAPEACHGENYLWRLYGERDLREWLGEF